MTNKTVQQIHSLLRQFNISRIVITPGSRAVPLICAIEQDDFFQVYSVVDERSAGFFALGLIQQSHQPVAALCTSGTAVANYCSAVIEAYYQRLPFLIISGDRMPELLNQNEDQLYDQIKTFQGYTKYQAKLPRIDTALDEWYTNRLINEALIELTHHGNGPVHIDFPIENPFVDVEESTGLVDARKINIVDAETDTDVLKNYAGMLRNKKVAVVWGQSVWHTDKLMRAANTFVDKFDAVVITDYMANCCCKRAVKNTLGLFEACKSQDIVSNIAADVVITIGGNTIINSALKNYAKKSTCWQVGKEDKVIDSYKNLQAMFEMSPEFFFGKMVEVADFENHTGFYQEWNEISGMIKEPVTEGYTELAVIKEFIHSIPEGSDLQIGNSWSSRMTQLMDIPDEVRVNCNRGANGIDGSVSTAIGYSVLNKNRLTYLCIGDLSFFYDMNALSIASIPPMLRIFLINNQGGSMLYKPFMKPLMEHEPMNNLGRGKALTVKGWAVDLGFKYISVHNMDELKEGLVVLNDKTSRQPVIMEVFTDMIADAKSYLDRNDNDLRDTKTQFKDSVKAAVKSTLGDKGVKAMKKYFQK